jgi:hypothetical protein
VNSDRIQERPGLVHNPPFRQGDYQRVLSHDLSRDPSIDRGGRLPCRTRQG